MFDYLMSPEALKLRDEVRAFVKSVPREMLNEMDQEKIRFPKEFLKEAGKRNLFGCRYPVKWVFTFIQWLAA